MDHTRVGLEFDAAFSFHVYFERVVSLALPTLLNNFLLL